MQKITLEKQLKVIVQDNQDTEIFQVNVDLPEVWFIGLFIIDYTVHAVILDGDQRYGAECSSVLSNIKGEQLISAPPILAKRFLNQ